MNSQMDKRARRRFTRGISKSRRQRLVAKRPEVFLLDTFQKQTLTYLSVETRVPEPLLHGTQIDASPEAASRGHCSKFV